jgi:hypothetical protein
MDVTSVTSKRISNKIPVELDGLLNLLAEMLADEFLREHNMNGFREGLFNENVRDK